MNKPTYADSEGNRYTTAEIDRRSDKAAKELIQEQLDNEGYNFCTKCLRNDCKPIDVAHLVSRKEAKESGRAELCWNKSFNMKIWGRKCHAEYDGLNIQNGNSELLQTELKE